MPHRVLVLADGELLFSGSTGRPAKPRQRRHRERLRRVPAGPRSLMAGGRAGCWQGHPDPAPLAGARLLLIVYPAAIAVLIGLALSRGPGLPRVAFLDEIPPSKP